MARTGGKTSFLSDTRPAPAAGGSSEKKAKRAVIKRTSASDVSKRQRRRSAIGKRIGVGAAVVTVCAAGAFGFVNRERLGLAAPTAPATPAPAPVGSADPSSVTETSGAAPGGRVEPEPVTPADIFAQPERAPAATPDPAMRTPLVEPPPALQVTDEERQEILRDPKRTLQAFLLAGSVDELLHYVADRDAVEADIRSYYPDGTRTPIATQAIDFDSSGLVPGTRRSAYMYWVTSLRRRIPVSVEETEQGYKVDWAAFTQFHDATLERFIRDPSSPPARFYVQLRRSHYFGNDIADIDALHAFRVRSPIAPHPEAYVFLRKSNPETRSILERFRWSKEYRPFVELRWVDPGDGAAPRIELASVVRNAWRR